MRRTKKSTWTILNITVALTGLWLVLRRYRGSSYMPGWKQTLTRQYGPDKARHLILEVSQELSGLAAETPVPENRILRWHLVENILPVLALYRVLLRQHNGDRQAALIVIEQVIRAWTLSKTRTRLMPLKLLPTPFFWFKLVFPQTLKKYPPEGWDIEVVNNTDEKIAFNISRCYYLNTLTALHAPELTASFCKGDDVMAELFPAPIRFVRPHTLGRGDNVCDFQYCRVEAG